MGTYTVPGIKSDAAERIIKLLQDRLNSLNDLALTLKHVHWNVTGPNFIAVHTMLDPQVEAVRAMVDETAERIAALGGSPCGTPGALVAQRDWDDYSIGRAGTQEHLGALDVVYAGIIKAHRGAIDTTEDLDLVTTVRPSPQSTNSMETRALPSLPAFASSSRRRHGSTSRTVVTSSSVHGPAPTV